MRFLGTPPPPFPLFNINQKRTLQSREGIRRVVRGRVDWRRAATSFSYSPPSPLVPSYWDFTGHLHPRLEVCPGDSQLALPPPLPCPIHPLPWFCLVAGGVSGGF
eukprot:Hpha_TRINITY_DN15313_c2_g2::TRINITY_DN15313_c2_g2_i3::g.90176::m.90176